MCQQINLYFVNWLNVYGCLITEFDGPSIYIRSVKTLYFKHPVSILRIQLSKSHLKVARKTF